MDVLKKNILVVDDDKKILDLFKVFLSEYNLICHTNAQEAWKSLDTQSFDLIITDLKMPILDGYEFINIVRKAQRNKDCPIILSSAFVDRSTYANLSLVHKVYYLDKPFSRDQLNSLIDKCFDSAIGRDINDEFVDSAFECVIRFLETHGLKIKSSEKVSSFDVLNIEEISTSFSLKMKDDQHFDFHCSMQQRVLFDLLGKFASTRISSWDETTMSLSYGFFEKFRDSFNSLDYSIISYSNPMIGKTLNWSPIMSIEFPGQCYLIDSDKGFIKIFVRSYQLES